MIEEIMSGHYRIGAEPRRDRLATMKWIIWDKEI